MESVPIVKTGIAIKTDPVEIKDTKFGNVTEIMKHTWNVLLGQKCSKTCCPAWQLQDPTNDS